MELPLGLGDSLTAPLINADLLPTTQKGDKKAKSGKWGFVPHAQCRGLHGNI